MYREDVDEPDLERWAGVTDDADPGGGRGDLYEPLPAEWSNGRRWSLAIAIVAGVVLTTLVVGGLFVQRRLDPSGGPGQEIEVQIPRGSSTNAIGDILEAKGVIPNASVFGMYVKYKGKGPFNAGTYELKANSAVWEVVPELEKGPEPVPSREFRVEPGLTIAELPAAVVDDLPGLDPARIEAGIKSGLLQSKYRTNPFSSYEGFLAPDTYKVPLGADEAFVLRLMIDQFDQMADSVGLNRSQELVGYDPYQVLIVASMVEAEAKVPADQAKIAGVIYNRLDVKPMPLGIDATLCYNHPKPCVLTQAELDAPGPYNTRLNLGLPPTPIALVSKSALSAALHPQRKDGDKSLLYFVLDPLLPQGQHLFTDNQQEFDQAKKRCQEAGACG
jgi:UPF0755 protein